MKTTILAIIISFGIQHFGLSQLPHEMSYYDSLRLAYSEIDSINEVKLIHETYKDGKTKKLYFLVRYDNETYDGGWMIGPSYEYYQNGQLHCYYHFNPMTRVQDSLVCYKSDGKVWILSTFPKNPTQTKRATIAFNKDNSTKPDFFLPLFYTQYSYTYKKGNIRTEYISYLNFTKKRFTTDSTITKLHNHKKGIINVNVSKDGQNLRTYTEKINELEE